jgi:ParB/RepB/Spo0J family partition protein
MDELKRSIYETGILVPLIVYRDETSGRYVLLDGERRWRCAKELNLPQVPANVIPPPTKIENIIHMFNIHNVREEWEPMPTAKKLEQIMQITGKTRDAELAQMTGIPEAQVKRLRVLLLFPKRFQDMVLNRQIKHDFLIEMFPAWRSIQKNAPEIAKRYTLDTFADALLAKGKSGGFQSVTEFRELAKLASAPTKGAPQEAVQVMVARVLESPNYSISDAYDSVRSLYDTEGLARRCRRLGEDLAEIRPADLADGTSDLPKAMTELRNVIDDKLSGLET